MNEVRWTGRVRIAKCGYGDDRFCGEEYQFREAELAFGVKRWETTCEVCALKWAIMACNIYSERLKLCKELAEVLRCDEHSAYLIAARSFKPSKHGDNGFTLRPVIHAQTHATVPMARPQNVVAYRAPYAS